MVRFESTSQDRKAEGMGESEKRACMDGPAEKLCGKCVCLKNRSDNSGSWHTMRLGETGSQLRGVPCHRSPEGLRQISVACVFVCLLAFAYG